jgi:Domain of unknown function (DUF1707)
MSSRPIVNPHLRISDAERTEVTEALKRHCSDGRLDSAEFEARLDRTLRAKTRGDLAGLFDDLPDLTPGSPTGVQTGKSSGRYSPGDYSSSAFGPFGSFGTFAAGAVSGRSRHRTTLWSVAMVGLAILAALAVLGAVAHAFSHLAWVIVLFVAFVIWRRGHHHRRHWDNAGRVEHVERDYPW